MDAGALKLIAAALAIGLGTIGPGIGAGLIGKGALESMGRNPEVSDNIRQNMILAIALVDSLAIFGLVIALIVLFVM
ncbi:ATP synthase F0 subunit C [candidate division WWE3 bacterium]|nr:ATP synthase F0 subunit C [candidate division WWE3 bacterium]